MKHLASFYKRGLEGALKHRSLMLLALFIIVWVLASVVFYRRFPDNFNLPNFFAEDGQHFTQNIMDKGVLSAMMTMFNGYYIWGIYALTAIGFGVNQLFFHGYFVNLPAALAVTSYAFLGLCAALPLVLLRRYLTFPYRLAIAVLICLLPMPSFDYGTIGTIGNLKFAFFYIAFLLLLYRVRLPRQARRIILIDLGLLFCAYTIAETYVVFPFLLLADGLRPGQLLRRKLWRQTFQRSNIAVWSAVGLAIIVAFQIALVAVRGVPELRGYLDEPYQLSKTIELFVARIYLYPFIAAVYRHMNDVLSLLIFAAGIAAAIKFGNRKHWPLYFYGVFSIFAATAVFVVNRTGVSIHYNHYQTTVFDNFFYPQNFIAIILGIFLLYDLSERFDWIRRWGLVWIACLLLAAGEIYASTSHPPTNFMPYQIGTIQQQLSVACAQRSAPKIEFAAYPFSFLKMTEPRAVACAGTASEFKTHLQSFGLTTLATDGLNIYPGQASFTQTFTASQNNLNGLAVYLSTYSQTRLSGYHLTLKDAKCQRQIQTVPLPLRVSDNAYSVVRFERIDNSAGTSYCFTITTDSPRSQKLAVQLSKETSFRGGDLQYLGVISDKDIVFQAVYR